MNYVMLIISASLLKKRSTSVAELQEIIPVKLVLDCDWGTGIQIIVDWIPASVGMTKGACKV